MKTYVFDTSALLRIYIPDGALAPESESSLEFASQGNALILAPELLLAEVAQVLYKKERAGFILHSEASLIQEEILRLPIDYVSHKSLIEQASKLARDYGLSVYDGLFLALALDAKARLISCDAALIKAANSSNPAQ